MKYFKAWLSAIWMEKLPRTHHAFLAIVSNNAKACIHGRWRAQLQLTTSQVSVHPVDAKQAKGCGITILFILSHHVALCCMSCCVVFGQWCQFHDDKLQGEVLRAQLPTASDSLPMTRWRNVATLHLSLRLWWYNVIYGDIMVVYDCILR